MKIEKLNFVFYGMISVIMRFFRGADLSGLEVAPFWITSL